MAASLRQEYGVENICLAGGVALNSVANGKLVRSDLFDGVWIQPAAGDAGGALGAALVGYHLHHQGARHAAAKVDAMQGAYLGPAFSDADIQAVLNQAGVAYQRLNDDELIAAAAQALVDKKIIGWFQGRMEFGPRALGNRSILGNPCSANSQSVMNQKIKFRESFRPFAPSVLAEDAQDYFELQQPSPYMLLVAPVRSERCLELSDEERTVIGIERASQARSDIPAVTHVDYTARIQTVSAESNPQYYKLIKHFKKLSGYGLVVNTSFNVRDEPIVCTPEDALRCFQKTAMDALYLGNYCLKKSGAGSGSRTRLTSLGS